MHPVLRLQHRYPPPRHSQRPLHPLEEPPLLFPRPSRARRSGATSSRPARAGPIIDVSKWLELILIADYHNAPAVPRREGP